MLPQLTCVGRDQVGGVGGREESLLAPLPLQLVEHLRVDAVGQGHDFAPHGGVKVVEPLSARSEGSPVRDPAGKCLVARRSAGVGAGLRPGAGGVVVHPGGVGGGLHGLGWRVAFAAELVVEGHQVRPKLPSPLLGPWPSPRSSPLVAASGAQVRRAPQPGGLRQVGPVEPVIVECLRDLLPLGPVLGELGLTGQLLGLIPRGLGDLE